MASTAASPRRNSRFAARVRRGVHAVRARPRLLTSAAVALAVVLVLPESRVSTRLLVGWDVGVLLNLVLVWTMMALSSHAALQRRADREDAGAVVVLVVTIAAAIASLVAIALELHGIKDTGGGRVETGRLGLAGGTILLSWFFVHTMFALHYAHDYYAGEDDRGGLKFPDEAKPDYWDFLYFAFTMGAASQTSDVTVVASRMRRFVLAHTILSFLFNTTVLALAINVGASLL